MYTLMIVDDHKYIIEGIQKCISFEDYNIELIATAQDGQDGLEKALQHNPDIIISDISMPNMSGLEMIKVLREKNLQPKIILLTGYNDFEYAREAMQYGVINYLSKPLLPNDIINALLDVIKLCDNDVAKRKRDEETRQLIEKSKPALIENFMEELFEGTLLAQSDFVTKSRFYDLHLENKSYRCCTVIIDNYKEFTEKNSEYDQQIIKLNILSVIREKINLQKEIINFKQNNVHFLLIVEPENTAIFTDEAIAPIMDNIINIIKEENNVIISIGIGQITEKFEGIHTSYIQSKEALKYTFSFGEGKTIFYADIINTQIIYPIVELYEREKLIDSLKMRNIAGIESVFSNMIANVQQLEIINSEYIKMIANEMISVIILTLYNLDEDISKELIDGKTMWELVSSVDSLMELSEILSKIFELLKDKIGIKTNLRNNRIVEQIIEYVEENYSKDISSTTLSQHIFLTPNYLSSIFFNEMGISFRNYLAKYRIEKAKELLLSGKYMVYEVSELVGYKNLDHFRKIFKEYTGINPSNLIN